MNIRRLLYGLFYTLLLSFQTFAQQSTDYSSYFAEAYRLYPNIPKGLLEATAYSASHLYNITPQTPGEGEGDATAMPQRFGIFALIEDGKGYFKNNLAAVCAASGITPEQFKKDVRLQILAVAKFMSQEAGAQKLNATSTAEEFSGVLEKLSEIPDDGNAINKYAHSLFTYDIYNHLQKGFSAPQLKQLPRDVQLEKIYPAQTLRLLRAPGVQVNYDRTIIAPTGAIMPANGSPETTDANSTARTETSNSVADVQSTDYPAALWKQASTSNFDVGRGGYKPTNVAIHTCEGSYSGTISWFQNPSAKVSAHYVVRSSDGQITQMVREKDKAFHVLNHNYYTIGIEHEGYVASGNSWYTDAMYKSSAALVRDICTSWNIDGTTCFRGPATSGTNFLPITVRIKGHQHYSGNTHTDPGIHWNWAKYADLINPRKAATTISFAVKDDNTGFGIPGAVIRVTDPDGKTSTVKAAANGKATVAAENGKYTFSIAASGYNPIETFFTTGTETNIEANIHLELSGASAIAAPQLRAPTDKTVVSGYVRDGDANTPLAGAQITAGTASTITDGKGFFSFQLPVTASIIAPGTVPQTVRIQFTKNGYASYTVQNFYVMPDSYSMQVALLPVSSARIQAKANAQQPLEENETMVHGLFDRKDADDEQRYGNTDVPQARVDATAAATVPKSIRVGTSCNCTSCSVVNVMTLEKYVQSGLDDEWISGWKAASLEAGAVAYRTYGAYYVLHPVSRNFDIASTTCNQVWQSDVATSCKNAANATAGIVLVKSGAIFRAEYSAENNNAGCGDGYSGTGTSGGWPCISDARCKGYAKNGHGRGMCQWGSSRWASDKTYTWILNHYYNPGSVYIQLPASAVAADQTSTTDQTNAETKADAAGTMKVSPNPVTGSSIIVEYTLGDASQPASIVVTDNYGNVSQQRSVVLQKGYNQLTIPISGLKAGIYNVTLRLSATGKAKTQKIIVVK